MPSSFVALGRGFSALPTLRLYRRRLNCGCNEMKRAFPPVSTHAVGVARAGGDAQIKRHVLIMMASFCLPLYVGAVWQATQFAWARVTVIYYERSSARAFVHVMLRTIGL